MGEGSKIEWTHHTFNIVWGCEKVSEACKNCYAESLAKRYGHNVWGRNGARRVMSDTYWEQPGKWDAAARKAGERHRVFCSSMADVFEDHPIVAEQRKSLWPLIVATPHLDWLLLTKRPENFRRMLPPHWVDHPRTNVWLGCTAENQARLEERMPHLTSIRAAVRFLSCEPLLGPLKLFGRPDWVIVGGESGHGARPMKPEWAKSVRDQCFKMGIPFHFKQWGDWGPTARGLIRLGKKNAGRDLDGRTWDGLPRCA